VHGSFHGTLHNGEAVETRFADFFRFNTDGTFSRRDTFFFVPLI
jgi:steroid delta-isomerase